MTAYSRELIYGNHCDWCRVFIPAGEIAWYNPKTKKVYHEYCLDDAESFGIF